MEDQEAGPVSPGDLVARELRTTRTRQRIPYTELSERLAALGRPIPVLGLRRIERGERRVDIDELVALGLALGVPPMALAFPLEDPAELVQMTADWSTPAWKAASWFEGEHVASTYASSADGGPWDLSEITASWWRATRAYSAAREHRMYMQLWADAHNPRADEQVVLWVEAQWRKSRQLAARFTDMGWLPALPPGLEHIDKPMEAMGAQKERSDQED